MAEIRIIDVTPPGWGEKLISSYLIIGSERTVLIETGPMSSHEKLASELEAHGARPDLILVTHIHLDHAGGAGALARRLGAKIVVHPRGLRHLADPSKLWKASKSVLGEIAEVYGEPQPAPVTGLIGAGDLSTIPLGNGEDILVVHTPGHASHHMAFHLRPQSILFTGDAAGVSVELPEGRLRIPTTPPPFKADLYLESLQKMARLNPQKIAPTHYGIDPKPGTEYLNDHILQTRAWLQTIEDLVRSGVTTVDEAAKKLAEKLPEARLAANTTNKIIYITFYTSTVWGMLEYIKEKLKTQK